MTIKSFFGLFTALIFSTTAYGDFAGPYAPGMWDDFNNPGPSVPDEVDVPGSFEFLAAGGGPGMDILVIDSPDCTAEEGEGCSGPGYDYIVETTADGDAFITFDWLWQTLDGWPYDRLGVFRNGEFLELIDGNGFGGFVAETPDFIDIQSGSAGFGVLDGDIFGFGLRSEDSCCEPSFSEITEFAVDTNNPYQEDFGFTTFVPVPPAIWLFGSAIAGLLLSRRR